jgi:hypothetical protein
MRLAVGGLKIFPMTIIITVLEILGAKRAGDLPFIVKDVTPVVDKGEG